MNRPKTLERCASDLEFLDQHSANRADSMNGGWNILPSRSLRSLSFSSQKVFLQQGTWILDLHCIPKLGAIRIHLSREEELWLCHCLRLIRKGFIRIKVEPVQRGVRALSEVGKIETISVNRKVLKNAVFYRLGSSQTIKSTPSWKQFVPFGRLSSPILFRLFPLGLLYTSSFLAAFGTIQVFPV